MAEVPTLYYQQMASRIFQEQTQNESFSHTIKKNGVLINKD